MVTNIPCQPTSKDERTLLSFAAKAAGIVGYRYVTPAVEHRLLTTRGVAVWNPLADDGDALRLAVKLRISVELDYVSGSAYPAVCATLPRRVWKRVPSGRTCVIQQYFVAADGVLDEADDVVEGLGVATRLAIVRAAAEIGNAMK